MGSHFTWATVWVLLALILLAIGGYDFLEKAQTVILAITLVCVLIAVAYVRPDRLAVLKGFVPRTLEYPDWVFAELPSLRDRSEWWKFWSTPPQSGDRARTIWPISRFCATRSGAEAI